MSDELDALDRASSLGNRLPFVSVIATFLFSGGVFLVFNVPLLVESARRQSFKGMDDLLLKGFLVFWPDVFKAGNGVVVLLALLFLSLVLGLLLTPINRLVTFVAVTCFGLVERRIAPKSHRSARPLFTAATFAGHDYAAFLSWLMPRASARAHWEWELFLYQLHWDLFVNTVIFVLLSAFLVWKAVVFWHLFLFVVLLPLLALSYGVARSIAMGAVHEHYVKMFIAERDSAPPEAAIK